MKNIIKNSVIVLGVALVIIGILNFTKGGAPNSDNSQTITIGAALAFSGDASAWGEVEKHGIEMAVRDYKQEHPNINVVVNYEDSKSTSTGGISAVQKLISIDHSQYIIGPTWLDSYPGAQALLDQYPDIVMVAPSATIAGIQIPKKYDRLYSLYNDIDKEAKNILDIMNTQNKKKIAILSLNDQYYDLIIQSLKKQSLQYGISVVAEERINYGENPKTALEKLNATGAESLLIASYDPGISTQAFRFVLQKVSKDTQIISTNIGEYLHANENNFDLIEGVYYFKPKSANREFVQKYKAAYGTEPQFSASQAYDSVMFILNVLEQGQDPKTIVQNTMTYGPITMSDMNGIKTDNQLYDLYMVKNGQEVRLNQ